MPQSLVNNVHHTVFSTKDRMKMVGDEWSQELYRYIGGSLNRIGCRLICAGGISDHVHLLSSIDKKMGVSDFVMKVKSSSSSWIHKNIPGRTKFARQRGYASFSVSESRIEGVTKYIQNQREHHQHRGFQEELKSLLEKHNLKYDERYLWN